MTRTASINVINDKDIPADPEAYYETLASQEEIYREETEEEVRAILISLDRSSTTKRRLNMTDEDDYTRLTETADEQLDQAAEELITGDSDDPPLSQEVVVEVHESRKRRTRIPTVDRAHAAGSITFSAEGRSAGNTRTCRCLVRRSNPHWSTTNKRLANPMRK